MERVKSLARVSGRNLNSFLVILSVISVITVAFTVGHDSYPNGCQIVL